MPDSRFIIAYMHLYKCGGTTFNWILQKCFPGRVLYCENSKRNNTPILKGQLNSYLEMGARDACALSSHLINFDALCCAHLVVTTIREPSSRIRSAYNFDILSGNFAGSFDEYIEVYRNFMVEKLGVPFLASLNTDRVFTCILEQYDLSLVCLEHHVIEKGLGPIDFAYRARLNVAPVLVPGSMSQVGKPTDRQLLRIQQINDIDHQFYEHQSQQLINYAKRIPDIDERLLDFRNRCKHLSSSENLLSSYGQGPDDFTYI